MAFGTKVRFEAVRELAFGGITGTYAAVGTALTDHARLVTITNSTDVEMYISLNGTTDHLRLASNSFKLYDFSANKIRDDGLFVPVGTIFYVRDVAAAAASGAVWIEVMYATGGV